MRPYNAPRCPSCRRRMELAGSADANRMKFYLCRHGFRVRSYDPPRRPIVGRVVRGRGHWARTVDDTLTERGWHDYGTRERMHRVYRPSDYNIKSARQAFFSSLNPR